MSATLNIGLVAYHAVGNLAFVKVPSERGRYMLTDLCVIAVPCPVCGAVIGEPCRAGHWNKGVQHEGWGSMRGRSTCHGTNVHCDRKLEADRKYGRGWKHTVLAHYKLHLDAGDVTAAMTDAPVPRAPEEGLDIDVPVTRRTDHA
ncbi:MAG: hypothetical protein V4641_05475 [Pseudomonadota bacterium]